MANLTFKNAQLKKLLQHSKTATAWKVGLAEAIAAWEKANGKEWNYNTEIPQEFYRSSTPTLFFVKDRGIYLMTGAVMEPWPTDNSHVCYATGYEPTAKNSWEKCRAAVGGDDFAETLQLSDKLQADIEAGADIILKVTAAQIRLSVVLPAKG